MMGKVVLNVRMDGLPNECGESFLSKDFLAIKVVPEMTPSPDINVRYIAGSKGSFSVTLDFHNREIIPPFMVRAAMSATAQDTAILATIDTSEVKQIRV